MTALYSRVHALESVTVQGKGRCVTGLSVKVDSKKCRVEKSRLGPAGNAEIA